MLTPLNPLIRPGSLQSIRARVKQKPDTDAPRNETYIGQNRMKKFGERVAAERQLLIDFIHSTGAPVEQKLLTGNVRLASVRRAAIRAEQFVIRKNIETLAAQQKTIPTAGGLIVQNSASSFGERRPLSPGGTVQTSSSKETTKTEEKKPSITPAILAGLGLLLFTSGG